ncbi:MAG: class I SAM-dependent methyltransferase [Novosphingobium sp.]
MNTLTMPQQEDIAFQARLYDDPNPTRRGLHRARKQWVEDRLEKFVSAGTTVLEVGVGCGIFTRYLSGKDVEVQAVDINQSFLDGVAGLTGVATLNGDATSDLGLRGFDVILCSEVIEHVPPSRSAAMVAQFQQALRPGGVVILSTPQRFATVELMARLFKFPPVLWLARKIYGSADELGHINLMTRTTLQGQIRSAGLTIEESDLFGFYLPFIAEFGGGPGAAFLQATGKILRKVPLLRGLLWTQAYVLRKS